MNKKKRQSQMTNKNGIKLKLDTRTYDKHLF